ncbi:pentatricopeptide repeat-containing protein At4g14050, mitochondrial-like [Wolffia australiana]
MSERRGGRLKQLHAILRLAIESRSPRHGQPAHACFIKLGLLSNLLCANRLLDLYFKCGLLPHAERLFDEMPRRDLFSWSTLLAAIAQSDHPHRAISLAPSMALVDGVSPDGFVFSAVAKACARSGALRHGRQLHARFSVSPFGADDVVKAALVDMYSKCGEPEEARKVFDEIRHRSVASVTAMVGGYAANGSHEAALELFRGQPHGHSLVLWTALISGLVQSGGGGAAVELFVEMRREGVAVTDPFVLAAAMAAAANEAALELGQQLHGLVVALGFAGSAFVGNALVDLYAKCGAIGSARALFESLPAKGVFSWTTMIVGEAQNGVPAAALALFRRMIAAGVQPNEVTFVGLIQACGHGGLVEKGRAFFRAMAEEYGIRPSLEHYTCLLDLLARAGRLAEAEETAAAVAVAPDAALWCALLSACWRWGDVERGVRIAERFLATEPGEASSTVLLSNILAEAGEWEHVGKARAAMGGSKTPGWSRLEMSRKSGCCCVFMAGGLESHPRREAIVEMLHALAMEMGKNEKSLEFPG